MQASLTGLTLRKGVENHPPTEKGDSYIEAMKKSVSTLALMKKEA